MKTALLSICLALFSLTSCTTKPSGNMPQKTEQQKPAAHFAPLRRFERVASATSIDNGQVAFDTVTGQLCRTWDWSFKNASLNGSVDTIPLCVNIYRQFPTNDPDDPFAQFGGSRVDYDALARQYGGTASAR